MIISIPKNSNLFLKQLYIFKRNNHLIEMKNFFYVAGISKIH